MGEKAREMRVCNNVKWQVLSIKKLFVIFVQHKIYILIVDDEVTVGELCKIYALFTLVRRIRNNKIFIIIKCLNKKIKRGLYLCLWATF